jgi:hypothetical protein
MMTPQLDPKLFLASKPAVGAMSPNSTAPAPPQSKQGSPLAMPAMSANAAPTMPMPQPKAANPNPLAGAFASFARGFAPQQTAAVDERYKADGMERNKKALAWMQQTAQLPAEQRAAFTLQSAQDIARDTGQTYEAVVASARDPNAFSDQELRGAIAKFSAMAGMAPEKPDPARFQGMGLGDGGVGVLNQSTGEMEVLREPGAPKPVQSDYVETQIGNEIYFVNKNNPDDKKLVGPAPPKGGGGGSDGEPTAYQLWQMQRAESEDARKAATQEGIDRTAVTNLQDGQERLRTLTSHPGFKGIYGPFGAMGINMGAKPTNVMNQDELNAMALLDQIGGEAFLAGVQKMRGTGPLSDNEGKRVSAAVTRLTNRMQSPQAAQQAADEFMASMRALEQAYMKESGGAAMPSGMSMPDDVESSGIFDDVMEGAANMFGGVADMFTGGGRQQQPVRVGSKEQRDALPPGTRYIAPDGSVKVKK